MKGDSEKQARVAFILFLLLGALITLAWYLVVSSQKNTYQIVTHENVSGLIVDAPVEFHGVEVGKVEEIELTNSRSVRIAFSVAEQAPINQATVATITARGLATRGFTGYVYIAWRIVGQIPSLCQSRPPISYRK